MAMNLSAASPIAGPGRPRFAARSMKVARSISQVSSWPSNSASFTPFEADAVSNMVGLMAVGSLFILALSTTLSGQRAVIQSNASPALQPNARAGRTDYPNGSTHRQIYVPQDVRFGLQILQPKLDDNRC